MPLSGYESVSARRRAWVPGPVWKRVVERERERERGREGVCLSVCLSVCSLFFSLVLLVCSSLVDLSVAFLHHVTPSHWRVALSPSRSPGRMLSLCRSVPLSLCPSVPPGDSATLGPCSPCDTAAVDGPGPVTVYVSRDVYRDCHVVSGDMSRDSPICHVICPVTRLSAT